MIENAPISPQDFLNMTPKDFLKDFWERCSGQEKEPLSLARSLAAYLLLASGVRILLGSAQKDRLYPVILGGFMAMLLPAALELFAELSGQAAAWNAYLAGFLPVLCGMVTAGGYPASALIFSGTFIGISSILSSFFGSALLPLLQIYCAVALSADFWGNPGMLRAAQLFLRALQLFVKGIAALLGILLGAQSMLATGADSFALKTGKFILANAVPIVGQAAADAFGGVLSGLRVVKGYLAFSAISTVFLTFLPVLIHCFLYLAVFYGCAVLADGLNISGCSGAVLHLCEGVKLCLSFLFLYFLLIFFSTIYLVLLGG